MAQMAGTGKLHTMLEACEEAGLTYQALKFYCNEGLVPGVRRDARNRRVFDDSALAWVKDLACLKRCGFGIAEMKEYLALCLQGEPTIPERKAMLDAKRAELAARIAELEESIGYIDRKQGFYDAVLAGEIPYMSNLIGPGWRHPLGRQAR